MSMRSDAASLEHFARTAVASGLYSNERNLLRHSAYLLGDLEAVHTALDVGGGSGLLSFYLASRGARDVTCLEPELDGSTTDITESFRRVGQELGLAEHVSLVRETFQEYAPGDQKFDLVVFANSINHIDERACISLRESAEARALYIGYFQKIFEMLKPGGHLVLTDCSCKNLFYLLHLPNPLARDIEWHKHQTPETWCSVAKEVGFRKVRVQWSSFNTLGRFGRVLMGNALINFLTLSHFRLLLQRPESS